MKEFLEPGRAPNCAYVQEYAWRINDVVSQQHDLGEMREHQEQRMTNAHAEKDKVTEHMAALTFDSLMERSFIRDDQEPAPASPLEQAMHGAWRINDLDHTYSSHVLDSVQRMEGIFAEMKAHSETNIDAHTSRHHKFGNMTCAYESDFITPWQQITTHTRAVGHLVMRKLRPKH